LYIGIHIFEFKWLGVQDADAWIGSVKASEKIPLSVSQLVNSGVEITSWLTWGLLTGLEVIFQGFMFIIGLAENIPTP
jgi:hypothetical protein